MPGVGEAASDVIVIGGGNAGLCAAISAAEAGASVTLLERAPIPYRGGNSRHTRNFRCSHGDDLGVLSGTYDLEEFYDDLLRVTKGNTDEKLAKHVIRNAPESYQWMAEHGVIFQPSLSGTLSLSRTNAFFLGGGKALVNAYYQRCEDLGVKIHYNATVLELQIEAGSCDGVLVDFKGSQSYLRGKSFVIASGGFESDKDWLAEAWGEAYDGGIVTRLDCVPFAVVLNKHGDRFYDEGEDVWPKRYAIWGRLVAAQPDQVAYAIIDEKSADLFMPSVFPATRADSISELCEKLGLPVEHSVATINTFNTACKDGNFHPTELDGLSTSGLTPEKTNWARAINEGPYYGYELRPGVTFTYLGVNVDEDARVTFDGVRSSNLWAAGEIMAGNILGEGYLAGFGMTIGTVFGRIAGRESAAAVLTDKVADQAENKETQKAAEHGIG